MVIARTVLRSAKYFCSAVRPRYSCLVEASYRNISTGQEHLKFGNIGGKVKDGSSPQQPFIGIWHETKCEDYKDYYKQLGFSGDDAKCNYKSKTWISYSIEDGTCTCMTGFLDTQDCTEYSFVLGQQFLFPSVNPIWKITITVEDNIMIEKQECITEPTHFIRITREDKGEKMKVVCTNKKHVVVFHGRVQNGDAK